MTTRLTLEEKADIIFEIQKNPIDPDWTSLAERYHRTENSLRGIYNSYISPEKHIALCLNSLTPEMIQQVMKSQETVCTTCKNVSYAYPKIWKSEKYCEVCYIEQFKEEIQLRWNIVNDYAKDTGKSECNICGIKAKYDSSIGSRFHFDHMNMFEKEDSISTMIQSGVSMEDIKSEIDHCQIVCISCHRIITAIERKCGFIRLKMKNTREKKDEKDENITKEYQIIMNPIYDQLRNQLRK